MLCGDERLFNLHHCDSLHILLEWLADQQLAMRHVQLMAVLAQRSLLQLQQQHRSLQPVLVRLRVHALRGWVAGLC